MRRITSLLAVKYRSSRLRNDFMASRVFPVIVLGIIASSGVYFLTQGRAAAVCNVSDKLVNSCRPWLGAAANKYPQAVAGTREQAEYHEQRIGRKLDIVHTYHSVGSNTLSADEKYFATRTGTYLFANWKPAARWAAAGGGNAATNATIDQMADSVRSLGPSKIFMTIHHEAENDVSGGASGCAPTTYKGAAGTTAEYRAMWQNVERRFAAKGVTNVVWVLDLMNYAPYNCMIDDMYPGNGFVDWIMFNAYGGPNATNYSGHVKNMYDLLTTTNDAAHNYLSKPWGIVEWNTRNSSEAEGVAYYNKIKSSLDTNEFPRLKAYMIFDSIGPDGNENRVAYTAGGIFSQRKQDAYTAFARDPRFTDAFYNTTAPQPPSPGPVPDTIKPAATVSVSPAAADLGASVTAAATASDNVGVTKVEFYADGVLKGTDTTAPYSATWSTVSAGTKPITAVAFDAAGNSATSVPASLTVTATPAPIPGDANNDRKVNGVDYSIVLVHFGQPFPAADFNKDGTVTVADLAILLAHWTW
jgi:hypothetical protein